MKHELITIDHPWMQKLAKIIGTAHVSVLLDQIHEDGLPFEVPAAFKKLTLNRAPEMELVFLDEGGDPIGEAPAKDLGNQDVARTGNWILKIDGVPQMHLRSVEIPKLEYSSNEMLTIGLTYNAKANPEKQGQCPDCGETYYRQPGIVCACK